MVLRNNMTRQTQMDTHPSQVRSNSNNFSQASAERLKLRRVKTQTILFLKSMSERDGSEIKTTLNLNGEFFSRVWVDLETHLVQSRSMSDPPHSDMDFKNKMACFLTTLNLVRARHFCLGTRTTGTRSFRGRGRSAEAYFSDSGPLVKWAAFFRWSLHPHEAA